MNEKLVTITAWVEDALHGDVQKPLRTRQNPRDDDVPQGIYFIRRFTKTGYLANVKGKVQKAFVSSECSMEEKLKQAIEYKNSAMQQIAIVQKFSG